jgi:hypothetical protein
MGDAAMGREKRSAAVSGSDLSWSDLDHIAPDVLEDLVRDPWWPEGGAGQTPARPLQHDTAQISLAHDAAPTEIPTGREFESPNRLDDRADEPPATTAIRDLETRLTGQLQAILAALLEDNHGDQESADLSDWLTAEPLVERFVEDEDTDSTDPSETDLSSAPFGDDILDPDWSDDDGPNDWWGAEVTAGVLDESPFGRVSDLDEDAHQRPWETDADDASVRRARSSGAAIAAALDLTSARDRQGALSFLIDFFERHKHPSTFRALESLAAAGLDFETLKSVIELRDIWTERPEWWVGRYGGEYISLRNGSSALSWRLSHQICLVREDYPAESKIDQEWLDQWFAAMPGSAGYMSFPEFLAVKVQNLSAETLCDGLRRRERSGDETEFADDYSWDRQPSERLGFSFASFRILTPHDDRPGVIRAVLREPPKDAE